MLTLRDILGVTLFAVLVLPGPFLLAQESGISVKVDWNKVERISNTSATLQVVVNPPLRRGSPIHDQAWNALRQLGADNVRFVPWYPYPRLGVAEIEPPSPGKTSWDFSLIDPLMEDFFAATANHPVMLNFSTIPQWMFKTKATVSFPSNPNEVSWSYEQGTELRDPSGEEAADYYARLLSWYTRGGFTDEIGQRHKSPHRYKIAYWEILNEPEYEHSLPADTYTRIYDSVASSIRQIAPETKFVGMSLAEPMKSAAFFEYFLNPKNHQPGVPLDMISYHFYAVPTADQTPATQQYTFFEQADKFLTAVGFIESIRHRLSPETKTTVNETGCILPDNIGQGLPGAEVKVIPASYWNLCGAMFAYLYAGLARQGIDFVGSSQLVGYPTQFPSVTMLDWNTGQPNARYWVLKLLLDNFHSQDRIVETKSSSPYVFAQGFVAADGTRKLLLVNKRDRSFEILVPGAKGATWQCADRTIGFTPPAITILSVERVVLQSSSVSVITLPVGLGQGQQ